MSAALDLFGASPAPPSVVDTATIRAAVERERLGLAKLGRFGAAAERQAVEIVRGTLRNAADLAEVQATPLRCHFCGDRLDDARPVVAVCTGRPKTPLWLHAGACHAALSRRHADRIDALMAAAGFGPGPDGLAAHQENPTP